MASLRRGKDESLAVSLLASHTVHDSSDKTNKILRGFIHKILKHDTF